MQIYLQNILSLNYLITILVCLPLGFYFTHFLGPYIWNYLSPDLSTDMFLEGISVSLTATVLFCKDNRFVGGSVGPVEPPVKQTSY